MSTEQSYIDIYKQCASTIKAGSPAGMNDLRDAAFDAFCQKGFPTGKNENYLRSDLHQKYAFDYGVNFQHFDIPFNPYDTFKCDIQSIKSYLFFVINDVFDDQHPQAQHYIDMLTKQGVIVGSMCKVASEHPTLFKKYYGLAVAKQNDGVLDFNTAFAMDGLFVYVPKGVSLDAPIQLINVMNADVPVIANSRNLIVVDEDARAQFMFCEHSSKAVNYLCNRVTEVFAERQSNAEIYKLEDSNAEMNNIGSLLVEQAEGAEVYINEMTLLNGYTRNNVAVNFNGEHCTLKLCGMAIADKCQHIDNHTFVNHQLPRCKSNQLYKYVLNDEAVGSFDGKVIVQPGAQKTEAYQSNKNIVATDKAKMFTKPHLEIYADDVKCSHGAAVGQLDENALFYMRQRGISECEARMLLMLAFADDVIETIKIEALRARMHLLIERRFRGDAYQCTACDGCKGEKN